jgi:hypothetical protein
MRESGYVLYEPTIKPTDVSKMSRSNSLKVLVEDMARDIKEISKENTSIKNILRAYIWCWMMWRGWGGDIRGGGK